MPWSTMRPEVVESLYVGYHLTGDPKYQVRLQSLLLHDPHNPTSDQALFWAGVELLDH